MIDDGTGGEQQRLLAEVDILKEAPEHLRLGPGHVQVRLQGLLGGPHLELCRAIPQTNT